MPPHRKKEGKDEQIILDVNNAEIEELGMVEIETRITINPKKKRRMRTMNPSSRYFGKKRE